MKRYKNYFKFKNNKIQTKKLFKSNRCAILKTKEMVNMKLLRLSAKNYKNCENDLSIDFVPIARKTEEDKTY